MHHHRLPHACWLALLCLLQRNRSGKRGIRYKYKYPVPPQFHCFIAHQASTLCPLSPSPVTCRYLSTPPSVLVPPPSVLWTAPQKPETSQTNSPPASKTHQRHTKGSYLTHQSLVLHLFFAHPSAVCVCLCLCSVSCLSPDKGTSISISFQIVPYLFFSPLLIARIVSLPLLHFYIPTRDSCTRKQHTHTHSLAQDRRYSTLVQPTPGSVTCEAIPGHRLSSSAQVPNRLPQRSTPKTLSNRRDNAQATHLTRAQPAFALRPVFFPLDCGNNGDPIALSK